MTSNATFHDYKAQRSDRPKVLIVEGLDDAYFFERILRERSASPDDVGVVIMNGKDNLDLTLKQLVKSGSFVRGEMEAYALICDADDNYMQTTKHVRDVFKMAGQPEQEHGSFIPVPNKPRVGLFVMPGEMRCGYLETLLLSTLERDAKLAEVSMFYGSVIARFGELDQGDKRISRLYLDCSPGHARGAGRAFNEGKFNSLHHSLDPLKRFVTDLLGTGE